MQKLTPRTLFSLALACWVAPARAQSDACMFIGELTLPAIQAGSLSACLISANPAACWLANTATMCMEQDACSGVISNVSASGCEYTVEKVGETIRLTGNAAKGFEYEVEETFRHLNSVNGMHWLRRSLTR